MRIHHVITKKHPRLRPAFVPAAVAVILTASLSSCGDDTSKQAATPSTVATTTPPSTTPATTTRPTTTPPSTAPATTTPPSTAAADTAQESIEIRVTDDAFEVSGPLRPGGTIQVSNVGAEAHFVQVRKIVDGRSFADAEAALQSQEQLDQIAPEIGAPSVIVTPGHTIEVTNPLLVQGEYMLLDWFPVEGDTTGAYHTDKGLVGHFSVTGEPASAPTPTASYLIKSGEAIVGPSVLPSGHHVFEIQFDGDAVNVFPTLIRLESGQTPEGAVKDLADVFGLEVWPVGSGKKLAVSIVASMYGPLGGTTFDVGTDLEPGTYVLAGLAYDDNGAPVLNASQITLTVDA